MTDVGDAIELTYATAPSSTVTLDWIHVPSGAVLLQDQAVSELLDGATHTGQYPVTLVGSLAGMFEARFTSTGAATNTESYFERFDAQGGPALLKRASQLVRDTYPRLDERIAAGTIPADSAGLAVLNMVARVMRNPQGLRSESTGPFSRAYDPDAASGMLQISDADAGLLLPPVITGRGAKGRVGTVRVTGGMVPPTHRRGWSHGPMYGPGGH
jgi:hypothetical protein